MSPRKRVISIFLILVLLVTAPFSIVMAQDEPTDDLNYLDAVYFFRGMYGLMQEEVSSPYTVACTQSGSNWCTVYSVTQGSSITNLAETFNIFSVPSGGSWSTYTAYNSSKRIRVSSDPLYIVFLSSTNFTTSNVTLYTQSGYSTSFTRITGTTQTVMTPAGYYLIVLKLWATNQHSQGYNFVTINMPGTTSTKIIPISYGVESTMSDNVHRLVFGTGQTYTVNDPNTQAKLENIKTKLDTVHTDLTSTNTKLDTINNSIGTTNTRINSLINLVSTDLSTISNQISGMDNNNVLYLTNISNLINTGNNSSTSSVNNVDSANQSLSQDFSQLSTIESGYNTDFNNQIQAINFNDQLSGQQGFLTSSSFVISVFNNLILNNPLTILIIIVSIFYVFRRFV